ncbi:MAG: sulfite exporter TauE/SafE family protein [Xanthomonadales bacterium]|nr:hypothetical protein [Xanthomonadales bacterium]MCC6594507.1 sulfite exporter TauE/SafE family protein [Xanthomonadales bacterium]MCE7930629.1 sulfite exporter TauE/SafE family protein [Xanthomonadales bacterium PRO6]
METLLIAVVAFGASLLTFYSGFGLGTLLMPAFALFVPLPLAIAATALVHLANNLFKGALLARHADRRVLLHFLPTALPAAFAGACLLSELAHLPPWFRYTLAGRELAVEPVKAVVGALILAFVLIEGHPRIREARLSSRWMPLGGLLSGFFGGLCGNQGALRSMFLVKCGLDASAFVATGVAIAVMIDLTRLAWYGPAQWVALEGAPAGMPLLIVIACISAIAGAWLGTHRLRKVRMPQVQKLVAACLMLVGGGLLLGWL